ncbi:nitroreductase family protein [Fusobacterium perfoetens]|uniref:nitroreductase family protein n=1 Tax=Fusobacterium perfoetens TaxID=852 RepID=UPI00048568E6|nr:nitroreductase family protein [Fusobacterium perfoetens]MCI6152274.1 nitroreductase family protein [Fusobacterium perfoetens]MDY3238132.1 nitroreductase family protein [Fusobacterium perfoetens]
MIRVDSNKCIKCKMCIKDCFPENIIFEEEKIKIKSDCMMCGHCVAVCPTNAITFEGYEETQELKSLDSKINSEVFLNFVKSRRSIRHFKDKKIDRDIIEKLLEVGRYSPTGANIQDVKYYVIQDKLEEFKPLVWEGINNFTNSGENNMFLRKYRSLFVEMYENRGIDDKLFFKAPMVLVITSSNKTNGVLAGDKIEMMANMMGLGVLFSGFIEMGITSNEELIKKFKLKRNVVCTCMLIGYPDISYQRTAPRKEINIEWL